MVEWNDSYSTGFPDLDAQHKVLFRHVNTLEEIISKGHPDEGRVEYILTLFEDYAKNHFGYEEDCMFAHSCPVAGKNKQAHQEFIKAFDVFHQRFSKEGPSLSLLKEIHQKTTDWLVNHICKIDTHLRDHKK